MRIREIGMWALNNTPSCWVFFFWVLFKEAPDEEISPHVFIMISVVRFYFCNMDTLHFADKHL